MMTNECEVAMTRPIDRLSIKYINECFNYNPITGDIFWKVRPRKHFSSDRGMNITNSRFAGSRAGSIRKCNDHLEYIDIRVDGKIVRAHRIAWALHWHEWPEYIDHINGNGLDNRIENLRSCSHQENKKNSPRQCNNTSGVTGVSWDKSRLLYEAYIWVDGFKRHLGYFDNIEEAKLERDYYSKYYEFSENHGRNVKDE